MRADRWWRLRAWRYRVVEKIVLRVLFALPSRVKDRVTIHRMGELTSRAPMLAPLTIGDITTDQYMRAMKQVARG